MITYDDCPACSHKKARALGGPEGIRECEQCQAVYGNCTRDEALKFVNLAQWDLGACTEERYYDFYLVDQSVRRHGWFNFASKKVTQTG